MQLIDNLLVVHNLDEKSTQLYDLKIQDYASPLIGPHLNVDGSLASKGLFVSQLTSEATGNEQFKGLGGMTEQVTQLYGTNAGGIVSQ
jgi:hypothetical protein